MKLLLSNGASLFLRNSEGHTALETVHKEATTSAKGTNQMAVLCFKILSRELKMSQAIILLLNVITSVYTKVLLMTWAGLTGV